MALRQRLEVALHVGDARRVVDAAVDQPVGIGHAVLGDVDRRQRVVAVDAHQQVGQALRVDLPAHVGLALQPGRWARRLLAGDPDARVVVDAEEVERLRDRVEIVCHEPAGRDARPLAVGVALEEDRVHVPAHEAARTRARPAPGRWRCRWRPRRATGSARCPAALSRRRRAWPAAPGRATAAGGAPPAPRPAGPSGRARTCRCGGPGCAVHQGSLWVAMAATRSPRRCAMRHRVVGEAQRGVAVEPAALVLQRLRQVPVVERGVRRDAALEQRRRRGGRRRPGPWRSTRPCPAAARAARRSRSGRRPGPGRRSGRCPAGSGGSGRRPRRRGRRGRSCPACAQKVSQIDGPRPSSAAAPSIW